jgi:hypothetical protein
MKNFWNWIWNKKEEPKEQSFTIDQVNELLKEIKKFNVGIIDQYLEMHVEKVFKDWVEKYSVDQ